MAEKRQIGKLRTIQNACVFLLIKTSKRKPTCDIYKENRILSLDQMIHLEHHKYGHHITHQNLPKPMKDILNPNGGCKKHKYPTRHKSTPNTQNHVGSQFNKSHLCRS